MSQGAPAFTVSRDRFDAVIFDLDGVVTGTARVHAAAWKKLFDPYLERRSAREGKNYRPFDPDEDYRRYVDGKPRYQGVQDFLQSRGIDLPYGDPSDSADTETVCGLGKRKNQLFHQELREHGVEVYETTVELLRKLKTKNIKTAIVSSSKNCAAVLEAANLSDLFQVRVDGQDAERLNLEGKPAPDIFLEAARRLGISPGRAVVVEDAISGVQAGSRGNFGCVLGVDRTGHAAELKESGATVVVSDLAEVAVGEGGSGNHGLSAALEQIKEMQAQGKEIAVFLDYDGTLTPIVRRPEQAVLSEEMRRTVKELAERCPVAVISGRDLEDVRRLVGIDSIYYAGSHGFDIAGPQGRHMQYQQGSNFLPLLDQAEADLRERLQGIAGALVERKQFSVAVHYREVNKEDVQAVEEVVDQVLAAHQGLRKGYGKKVYEVQPDIDWHKGKALLWLLEALGLDRPQVLPIYIGDDVTDEDAFKAVAERGLGMMVAEEARSSAAGYRLAAPEEVRRFLEGLAEILEGRE